jgi:hypothetical protein
VSESEEPEGDEEAEGGRWTRQKHTPSAKGGGTPPGPLKFFFLKKNEWNNFVTKQRILCFCP